MTSKVIIIIALHFGLLSSVLLWLALGKRDKVGGMSVRMLGFWLGFVLAWTTRGFIL